MSRTPKRPGDTKVHTIIVDWDGTAVPSMWPDRPTEFMPGFVHAMRRFHKAGLRITIFSARLNPFDPWSGGTLRRTDATIFEETQYVRMMLDRAGLTFVDIYTKEGKPGGTVYIDDKAERYGGRPGSWAKMEEKVLLRCGREEAAFPPQEHS